MKALLLSLAATVLAVAPGAAADEPIAAHGPATLKLRVKSALESAVVPPTARAPLLAQRGEPVLDLMPRSGDPRLKASRSSCEEPGRSLCYDPGSNKIVYKKTREYMPELPGLRSEHIAVRRDRVTFKYSFPQGARRRRRAPPAATQSNPGPR